MSKKQITVITVLFLLLTFNTPAQKLLSQKYEQPVSEINYVVIGNNDRFVMHALRALHSAEMTYQATYGAGAFGDLVNLNAAELIDPLIASGERYGYRFTLTATAPTASTLAAFELKATPADRRAKRLSFYMNEACDIRGEIKFGREATVADPIIESCGTSQRTENERLSIASLRMIFAAQMNYRDTYGAGDYGSLDNLYQTSLATTGFALTRIYRGYVCAMTVTARTATTPPRFALKIVPQEYGRSGIKSFYLDETGILRGADKRGQPADENDPPIEN